MKKMIFMLFLSIASISLMGQSDNLPQVELKTLDGTRVMSSDILDSSTATVLLFWKSESLQCCDNLDNMQTAWINSLQDQGVKMVAVCTDFHGSWGDIKPIASGKNWEFDIYIDPNGDLKHAMNIATLPSTMLYDKNNKLICSQAGFCGGNEETICEGVMNNLGIISTDDIGK